MKLNNLRNDAAFVSLRSTVREICEGKHVLYTPNVGNWGDALIHRGNVQFLESAGIKFTTMTRNRIDRIREALFDTGLRLQDTVLLAGGGGSWCEAWHGARDFVARNASLVDHVVMLPSTYELPALPDVSNITYIRRDNQHSLEVMPNSIFCHDAAFFLGLPGPENEPVVQEGHFFREDREKHDAAVKPHTNMDISLLGTDRKAVTPFFQILSNYQTLHTDRMHVAIAGSLLGRKVTLYPGSYFKSTDVFKSSIEPNYPGTQLAEWAEALA